MKRNADRLLLVSLLVLTAALGGCSGGKKKTAASERYQLDKGTLVMKNGIQLEVEIARTEAARDQAPADLYALCENCGLLVAIGSSVPGRFSTEKMKMDVDLVWMNGFTVIGSVSGLKAAGESSAPSVVLSPSPVTEYLLLPPGAIERLRVEQGDSYRMSRT